jgi:hypothetical protein
MHNKSQEMIDFSAGTFRRSPPDLTIGADKDVLAALLPTPIEAASLAPRASPKW